MPQREHVEKGAGQKADWSLPEERQEQGPTGGNAGVWKGIHLR